jgi:hypothetical protein
MEKDFCPFLTSDFLCELQVKDPDLKPRDCYMHPVFPKVDENGNIKLFVNPCCDVYKHLSQEFLERAKKLIMEYPPEHRKGLFEHQIEHGFPLIELK